MNTNHLGRIHTHRRSGFSLAALTTLVLAQPMPAAEDTKPPGPGDRAPPISLNALTNAPEGAEANWDAWAKGVVVIEFWGTWCAPCIQAIPHINELHEKFHPKGVRFLSVTFEEPKLIARFVKRKPIATWIGHDTDKTMVEAYDVEGWPTTFVVRDGVIVARTRPHALTTERLEAILEGNDDPGEPEEPARTAGQQLGEDGRPVFVVLSNGGHDPYSMIPEESPIFQIIVRPAGIMSGSCGSRSGRTLIGYSLRDIVSGLWGVPPHSVVVEENIAAQRYDVIYRVPWDDLDAYMPVVRDLVSRSLEFRIDNERRQVDAFALRIAKGGCKLEEGVGKDSGWGINSSSGRVQITGAGMDFDVFASILAGYVDRPVVNETGLNGTFFIDLELPTDPAELDPALKEKAGLVLKPIKHEIDVLIVTPREKKEKEASD